MFNQKYKEQIIGLQTENEELKSRLAQIDNYHKLKAEIEEFNDELYYQDLNIYTPHFSYKDTEDYKAALIQNIQQQKQLIKLNAAIIYPDKSKVGFNGNNKNGYKIVTTFAYNMLAAFNALCDNIISKASLYNYENLSERILTKYNKINSGGELLDIKITEDYFNLKIIQLQLECDKAYKKEQERQEKERQKDILKEQQKLLDDIEKAQAALQKEKTHYETQIAANPDNPDLQTKLDNINTTMAQNEYKATHSTAGYVYVLANPSLGENVYKIGVTRCLDPMDRVDSLSNASVPFKFKPNCFIFTDDAFALETALHHEFAQYRVNKVNAHKEYFKLPIDKIAEVIYNKYNKEVQWDFKPINEEYLLSVKGETDEAQ